MSPGVVGEGLAAAMDAVRTGVTVPALYVTSGNLDSVMEEHTRTYPSGSASLSDSLRHLGVSDLGE